MGLFDLVKAVTRAAPPAGGDGRVRTNSGEELDLELYKRDNCPYCQRVFGVVDKLRVPVRLRDIQKDPAAEKRLIEIGGKRQVPCLFIDGKPLYESADIVRFLEARFP